MLTALFETTAGLTIVNALLLILCAAACGLVIAMTAVFTGDCSRSFAISLVTLPVVVQVVILMVNGNLGTGVAVMGAFSLIRFRSVPGSSKDITLIFLAMAVGLATGMAYIGYAILITIAVCCGIITLTKTNFGGWRQPLRLRITIPEDLDYADVFDDILQSYTTKYQMLGVKTTNMGSMFELRYQVVLKNDKIQKDFIDALRCRNGNLTIVLNHSSTGNEEL